jgi:uncharacterized protein YjiS (DUF1127 family)
MFEKHQTFNDFIFLDIFRMFPVFHSSCFFSLLEHIINVMKDTFNIPKESETRLWNKYMRNTFELLSNKEQTVQDVGLYQGQVGKYMFNDVRHKGI